MSIFGEEKVRLKKDDIIYRFMQTKFDRTIVGEKEFDNGGFSCFMLKSVSQKDGNDFYLKLKREGFKEIALSKVI